MSNCSINTVWDIFITTPPHCLLDFGKWLIDLIFEDSLVNVLNFFHMGGNHAHRSKKSFLYQSKSEQNLFSLSLMSRKLMSEFNMKGVEKKHQKKKMKFSSTLTYSLVIGKSACYSLYKGIECVWNLILMTACCCGDWHHSL